MKITARIYVAVFFDNGKSFCVFGIRALIFYSFFLVWINHSLLIQADVEFD